MPKTKSEGSKKHGDVLEDLVDRTARRDAAPEKRQESGNDPAELQDDADEDVQNDPAEEQRRDVGERR
jgi:hypothetical protein